MPEKDDRSKRRRPKKGFPNRVAGYLDGPTYELVAKAAEEVGESIRFERSEKRTVTVPSKRKWLSGSVYNPTFRR